MGTTRKRLTTQGLGFVELPRVRLKSQGVQPETGLRALGSPSPPQEPAPGPHCRLKSLKGTWASEAEWGPRAEGRGGRVGGRASRLGRRKRHRVIGGETKTGLSSRDRDRMAVRLKERSKEAAWCLKGRQEP